MSATLSAKTRIDKDVPYGLTVAAAWSWRVVAIAGLLFVLWHAFGAVSLILIPVLVASLLATLLSPLFAFLRRMRLPRIAAALLCVILLLVVVLGLAALAGQQIVQGFADLSDRLGQALDSGVAWLAGLGLPLKLDSGMLDSVWETVRNNSSTVLNSAVSVGGTAANVLTGSVIALFTLIFFLYDGERIWRFLLVFVPRAHRFSVGRAGRSGWHSLGSYVRVQIFVAFVDAVGIGLGALLLGVPLWFPLSVLVFLASFIPMIGATLTGAMAVLLALMSNGLVNALLMLGVVILVQQLESNVLQPLVMGKAVALHPLAVFLAVATGATVMGLVGAVFAVPVLAFVNSFIRSLTAGVPEELTDRPEEALLPEVPTETPGSHVFRPADHDDAALAAPEEAGVRSERA